MEILCHSTMLNVLVAIASVFQNHINVEKIIVFFFFASFSATISLVMDFHRMLYFLLFDKWSTSIVSKLFGCSFSPGLLYRCHFGFGLFSCLWLPIRRLLLSWSILEYFAELVRRVKWWISWTSFLYIPKAIFQRVFFNTELFQVFLSL